MKTLLARLRRDRASLPLPRSAQEILPIQRIWADGIFLSGGQFSKSWKFPDVNYTVAADSDKEAIFRAYGDMLNSLDSEITAKITVCNRRIHREVFERDSLLPLQEDDLDVYRREYNAMLLERATSGNRMLRERYITLSLHRRDIAEARLAFSRMGTELAARFSAMGSTLEELDAQERLRVFHDFFRAGHEVDFSFDLQEAMRLGRHFADDVCPIGVECHADHLRLGEKYARVLFCQGYPSFLRDDILCVLTELPRNLFLSIDILPVSTDEAVREVESKLLGAETNIANWQRKQNRNQNFSADVPYDLEQQRKETREFLDDLSSRDQRMLYTVLTLVHLADSKAELDADTDALRAAARQRLCTLTTLRFQQLEGLHTALPFGLRRVDTLRTMTTESAGALLPFRAQEVVHPNGIYHGLSPVNRNLIFVDRRQLLNGNGCILGVSGSGKSFFGKMEIVPLVLRGGADVLLIDPEAEYLALTERLGGEVIRVSASSPHHINALDMARGYGDENQPLALKSEFLLSLFEQLYLAGNPLGAEGQSLQPRQRSILDRCVGEVYAGYLRSGYTADPPTLHDLHDALLRQPEPEAKALALDVELYVTGSLNTFAQKTNVSLDRSLIAFEIRELGSALQPLGMLVILDAIYNRLLQIQQKGRETWIFVDEAYLLFRSPYSANFFYKLWKRIRKQNGFATAITQNIDELLRSETARLMLANSEYLVLLNQAASDREQLSSLLHIPDAQLSYVKDAPPGQGLLKCGGCIVPFADRFPRDTQLYRLMTTRPSDLYDSPLEGGSHAKNAETRPDD